jgi:hypothetical protein
MQLNAKNMQKASNFGKGGIMLSRHPNGEIQMNEHQNSYSGKVGISFHPS